MANSECVLPPAGTSSLQYHKMPNAKCVVPDHQTGIEFLASSHFTISQDPSVTDNSMKSIFRKDYIPWRIEEKPSAAIPPKPADVLLKDPRYFNHRQSETRNAYEYRFLEKPVVRDVSEQLRATNFKMHRDPRFDSFKTTHNVDYTPKQAGKLPGRPIGMQSFIPQGDPDKAPHPVSDYRDRYRGHDVCENRVEKASGKQPGNSFIQWQWWTGSSSSHIVLDAMHYQCILQYL